MFKKNKEFLASMDLKKKDFDFVIVETAMDMIECKYRSIDKKWTATTLAETDYESV